MKNIIIYSFVQEVNKTCISLNPALLPHDKNDHSYSAISAYGWHTAMYRHVGPSASLQILRHSSQLITIWTKWRWTRILMPYFQELTLREWFIILIFTHIVMMFCIFLKLNKMNIINHMKIWVFAIRHAWTIQTCVFLVDNNCFSDVDLYRLIFYHSGKLRFQDRLGWISVNSGIHYYIRSGAVGCF